MKFPNTLRTTGLVLLVLSLITFTGCLDEIDEGAPITTILNPSPGPVSGIIKIVAVSSDDKTVGSIHLLIDGVEVVSENSDLVMFDWNTAPLANDGENHNIAAYGIDEDDNIGPSALTTVQVVVDTTTLAPVVSPELFTVVSPQAGDIIEKSTGQSDIRITIELADEITMDALRMTINGQDAKFTRLYGATYECNRPLADPTNKRVHTYFIKATDESGASTAALIPVSVRD